MFDGNTFTQFGTLAQTFAELGRTTLGSANSTISISGLPNKKWLILLCYLGQTASLKPLLTFNSDTGSNYAQRESINGGADSTATSQTSIPIPNSSITTPNFSVIFIENTSANEKLVISHTVDGSTAGAGTATGRWETVGKWADTSNAISTVTFTTSTSTFISGSEVVVLGADPSDTIVTPFFKELGRNTLGSSGTTCNVTGLTAKKYMFITGYFIPTGGTAAAIWRFNSDSASHYSYRQSTNGGADSTSTSDTLISGSSSGATPDYDEIFIVNVATQEKLMIEHNVGQGTSGAANAPSRRELVGKWTDTTNQITEVDASTTTNNFASGTEVIVYGEN